MSKRIFDPAGADADLADLYTALEEATDELARLSIDAVEKRRAADRRWAEEMGTVALGEDRLTNEDARKATVQLACADVDDDADMAETLQRNQLRVTNRIEQQIGICRSFISLRKVV